MESLHQRRVSPTEFMRQLRPEYYSDTVNRKRYELTGPELEYRLSTITARNEMHAFEIFCRKLCERAICPNLRPATGPEGGGDGKADTETFPVAEEISCSWYLGKAQAATESWAFAFSANANWKKKVRSDVEGLVQTGRPYKQIICVTSQFARSRDRSELQDELRASHGVPITIHDRGWIVDQVIEHRWEDLAINYLGVGSESTDRSKSGPMDYSRETQLEELERQLADVEAFSGMEIQRATEALVAAKLSRSLERPRLETDGRFTRAIRFAAKHGTHRQQLEAEYESIRTAYWWYDDFDLLNERYGVLESMAIDSSYALNLEFLANCAQLLFNTVLHGHRTASELQLDGRVSRLKERLSAIADEGERPNNALEAKVSLLMLQASQAVLEQNNDGIAKLWPQFSEILTQARGLGEFAAERMTELISVIGEVAGDNSAYASLVDEVASFVADRTGEAQGAIVLLKRARQVEDSVEMIRILGRAARQLSKREYREQQVEALLLLAGAYRDIGMLWAARANVLVALASKFIEAEEESRIPDAMVVPLSLYLCSIDFELRYFPEAFSVLRLARACASNLPLDEESRRRFAGQLKEQDHVVACQLVALADESLEKASRLPDLLGRLQLVVSRYALLYALGYQEILREEGWAPDTESAEHVQQIFNLMASQPCATGEVDIFNSVGHAQSLVTRVIGMRIEVLHKCSDTSAVVAELVAGAIEVLFATALQSKVFAHTEGFLIEIEETEDVDDPTFTHTKGRMTAVLHWPAHLPPASSERQGTIRSVLMKVVYTVLVATCVAESIEDTLENLVKSESFLDRLVMLIVAGNSRNRTMSGGISRIDDFNEASFKAYPPKLDRPQITRVELPPDAQQADEHSVDELPGDHRHVQVLSVIDTHLWSLAHWRGTGFGDPGPGMPPILGLLFEDEESARKIFLGWRERFGESDEKEEIYLAVVRQLSEEHPFHYAVIVASATPPESSNLKMVSVVTRSKIMPATSSRHLDGFLAAFTSFQAYLLAPMVPSEEDPPMFLLEHALLKRQLSVKNANDISGEDIESIVIHQYSKGEAEQAGHGQ